MYYVFCLLMGHHGLRIIERNKLIEVELKKLAMPFKRDIVSDGARKQGVCHIVALPFT